MNRSACILVVDDEPAQLYLFARILSEAGYEVQEATSGEECLRQCREVHPDLVLLDWVLPDLEGLQVCQQIKADPELAHTTVVIVSAFKTSGEYRADALEGGADGYLSRPIGRRELLAQVQTMIRLRDTEKALRESDARYRELYDQAPVGYHEIDRNGHLVRVNLTEASMLGYSIDEMLGQPVWRFLVPSQRELAEQAVAAKMVERQAIRGFERTYLHRDGHEIDVYIEERLVYDARGEVAGIRSTVQDVTARRQMEQALQDSRTLLQSVVDRTPNCIFVKDREGRYVLANRAMAALYGVEPEEMIGRTDLEFAHVQRLGEEEASKFMADDWQVISDQRAKSIPEESFTLPDGTCRWFQTTLVPLTLGGAVDHVLGVAVDITEHRRAQDMLLEASAQLEETIRERTAELRAAQDKLLRQERLAVLGQLSGSVGHELRTPLGAISNAAYLLNILLDREGVDPGVGEALDILNREILACDRIIDSLLDFARCRVPRRRETAVNDLIRQSLARVPVSPHVEVVCDLDGGLPPTALDPDQMTQVFCNLVLNGVQAMPEGGTLTISSRCASTDQACCVAVAFRDTGGGISKENLDQIFEPLFTTKASGIGLGLSLVKMLVEAHGGTIDVYSRVGVGSTFTVTLPVTGSEQAEDGMGGGL